MPVGSAVRTIRPGDDCAKFTNSAVSVVLFFETSVINVRNKVIDTVIIKRPNGVCLRNCFNITSFKLQREMYNVN